MVIAGATNEAHLPVDICVFRHRGLGKSESSNFVNRELWLQLNLALVGFCFGRIFAFVSSLASVDCQKAFLILTLDLFISFLRILGLPNDKTWLEHGESSAEGFVQEHRQIELNFYYIKQINILF